MNLIFFSRRQGQARHLQLTHPVTLTLAGIAGLAVLGATFALGMTLGSRSGFDGRAQVAELGLLREQVQDRIDAMAVRMGELNAHVLRIDALGKRLTQLANISSKELNFDVAPGMGGPEEPLEGAASAGAQIPDLTRMLDDLQRRIETRDSQLLALETVILSRSLNDSLRPEGRPVEAGYISSYYGGRSDPFDGSSAMHRGLDFAGAMGSNVLAVAAGIVTRVDRQAGYGNLVEISHGSGYSTRYAHNSQVLVKVGETVTRGQPVALMGSTGRSTGPHVHFEVLRNGRHLNPLAFVNE